MMLRDSILRLRTSNVNPSYGSRQVRTAEDSSGRGNYQRCHGDSALRRRVGFRGARRSQISGLAKNPAPCGPPDLGFFYQRKFGGIQTILTAEKGLGIKAFLPFAPAAQSWNPVLADRLKRAVRQARVPIFIIQAQNDYSLEPSKVLGRELEKKGSPNHAKVYPSFGSTTQEGHWAFGSRRDGIHSGRRMSTRSLT